MSVPDKHTILLGGIGGDSHSVGLTILRNALSQRYQVFYIGTQNPLQKFFDLAPLANVVMVSCMDGHARHYLREFSEQHRSRGTAQTPWYLGGNLTIGDALGYDRMFLDAGFRRVFPKFVDLSVVLDMLEADLVGVEPIHGNLELWERSRPVSLSLFKEQSEQKIPISDFEKMRKDVLSTWRTGAAAKDLEENANFLAKQPSFAAFQKRVLDGEMPMLIQPRCGVALIDKQIALFKTFRDIGVRVLSYQVDSFTRNNNYAAAAEEIAQSSIAESGLNGFPVINHGVPALRRVISEVGVPLQVRHSTREPRLLAEISYAGGASAFEGGVICYNIPYYSDYQLAHSIPAWQYVDRLTGLYFDRYGIVLDREYFGTLTGTLVPPCLAIATGILESLLAVQQGVRCVSIGYAEQGHRIQDIAAIRTINTLAGELIRNAGFEHVQVNSIFCQYMAAFPPLPHLAEALIKESAVTAALSGATRMLTKTPVEAYKIPTLHDNLQGLQLNMSGVKEAQGQRVDEVRVEEEAAIIRREVQSIIDAVIFCGKGNIASGIVKAFQEGILDIPFAPSLYNRGEVMTARDAEGAVRFLRLGKLPFDRDLREFHDHRMNDRRRSEGLVNNRSDNELVEKDVLRIARGQYESWPLYK